ncbi:3'(2'),5'-bisphosphate nucleotidase 1 isoform 2-T3 [Menidia menidia]
MHSVPQFAGLFCVAFTFIFFPLPFEYPCSSSLCFLILSLLTPASRCLHLQGVAQKPKKGPDTSLTYSTAFWLLDNVTVLIGVAYGGRAIAGIINQPFYNYQLGAGADLGRTMWGIVGLGAFGCQLQEVPGDRRIVTTTRSHSNKVVTDCVNAMEPHEVIRVGGAGNKIIQLLEGKASAYVFASPGCKKWDTCAPEAILHAVGGKLTDMYGNAYHYDADVKLMNSAGVLATLHNHEYYVNRVPQSVLEALKSD